MNHPKNRYLYYVLILFLLCAGILLLIEKFAPAEAVHPWSWGLLVFFCLLTLAQHAVLMKAAAKDPKAFVRTFMALTGIKMFAVVIAILVILGTGLMNPKLFTLYFLAFYLLFLVFETGYLYRQFGRKN